ncbi:MAG TPA: hypothetical protein VFU16_08615 [Solirubrobacterales bacterium]|nr:hypothetical protein [Solirubrobacterales bacterium]
METSEFLAGFSSDSVKLERVAHFTPGGKVVEIGSAEEMKRAYARRVGVLWAHWDVDALRLERGSEEALEVFHGEFLARFLTECLRPEQDDAVSQIVKWRMNIVRSAAFGGLSEFSDENDGGSICMFDSQVFDIVYSFPSEIEREMLRESWRRVAWQSHVVAGIAVPFLALTVRNAADPVFFDAELRRKDEEDREHEMPWNWSYTGLEKAVRHWSEEFPHEFRSGDLLAAVSRECVESYEEIRSWLMAQAEEVEVARLAPDLVDLRIDQADLARRHHWLLQQASRARAALDWSHDGREVPEDLFSGTRTRTVTEDRRQALLHNVTAARSTLRSALDLVSSASAAEQLALTRAEAARSSAFQSAITFVTTVLLAPGLVAAIFGALPSVLADRPTARLMLLTALMLVAAGGSALVLRRIRAQSVKVGGYPGNAAGDRGA